MPIFLYEIENTGPAPYWLFTERHSHFFGACSSNFVHPTFNLINVAKVTTIHTNRGVCIGLVGNPRKKRCICYFENAQSSELWKCGNWIAGPGSKFTVGYEVDDNRNHIHQTVFVATHRISSSADSRPIGIHSFHLMTKMFRFVLLLQQFMPTSILAGTYILPHKVLVGIRVVWLNPEVHCRLPTACFQGNGSRHCINKCCVVIWTYKEYMKLSFKKTANCIFGYLLE